MNWFSMSTTTRSVEPSTKAARLEQYLTERAEEGEFYFKGKFISDDVGLSPKEIGALMVQLTDDAADITVEKWSYTSATTWRVAPV